MTKKKSFLTQQQMHWLCRELEDKGFNGADHCKGWEPYPSWDAAARHLSTLLGFSVSTHNLQTAVNIIGGKPEWIVKSTNTNPVINMIYQDRQRLDAIEARLKQIEMETKSN